MFPFLIGLAVGAAVCLLVCRVCQKTLGILQIVIDDTEPDEMPYMLMNLGVGVDEATKHKSGRFAIEVCHYDAQKKQVL